MSYANIDISSSQICVMVALSLTCQKIVAPQIGHPCNIIIYMYTCTMLKPMPVVYLYDDIDDWREDEGIPSNKIPLQHDTYSLL